MSRAAPVSQGEELGPTPSVLCQTAIDERFGHMHSMIDSDEEPLVRGKVIDSGHSSVLLPDMESQAILGSFGAGFSRQQHSKEITLFPGLRQFSPPTMMRHRCWTHWREIWQVQWCFPCQLVLRLKTGADPTWWDCTISPGQVSFPECKHGKPSCQR